MTGNHTPNVIRLGNGQRPKLGSVMVLLFFGFLVIVAAVVIGVIYTISTSDEPSYKTYNVGGPIEVGTIDYDGHKFIVTNPPGATLTHHPDCPCQGRAEQ